MTGETEVTALTLKTATADLLLRIFDSHAQRRIEDWTTQSKIIKNTVHRKKPIVQQKINQVSKQKGTRSRASTLDKLAVVPSVIQSQDPPDSTDYEAWIRQRPNKQKINQFDQHVKILEEQYIGKAIDVPVMSQRKSSNNPNRSPRMAEMHQVQPIDTVHNIFENRQRQVPRTSTAQWQDPGDFSCDATQIPMIQKMQKTVGTLQGQFIDKVVEISEIMQSKDKCQRSRRYGNSRKFTDRMVDVPIVLKRQCQPSAQILKRVPTTGPNDVNPQSSQTPSAKTKLTMSSRERQPVERCQMCLEHEREM